jgi:hypothetical protein
VSYVPDVTGHRWKWIFTKWPHVSQNLRFLIDEVFGDPAIDWHPTDRGRGSVTFSRHIVDGDWPHDREVVTVRVDSLGRLKGCTREKVIHIESGRSYADLRRMLRLRTEGGS